MDFLTLPLTSSVTGRMTPFQDLRTGSCLTLGNELSKETCVLTKQKNLSGRGAQGESFSIREPRRAACHTTLSLAFYGNGISFSVVSNNHLVCAHNWSSFRFFWRHMNVLAKMDSRVRASGRLAGHMISWHLLPPFGPSLILPVSSLLEPPVAIPLI